VSSEHALLHSSSIAEAADTYVVCAPVLREQLSAPTGPIDVDHVIF
jgi:hypothetical protein